jgi:hypothetical protein
MPALLRCLYDGLGMHGRGLELIEQASGLTKVKLPVFKGYVFTAWAYLLRRQDRLTEAQSLLQQTQQDAFVKAHPAALVWCEVEVTEAELALRQGDSERALTLTSQLLPYLCQTAISIRLPRALYVQGQDWLAQGNTDAALAS